MSSPFWFSRFTYKLLQTLLLAYMYGEVLFRIHHRRALLQSCLRLNKVTGGERGWRRIIVYAPPPSHFNIYVG